MLVLTLQRIDDEQKAIVFTIGEHVIGRGSPLQCTSKKISRKHALLRVTNNTSCLVSTHPNPCFHQSADSQHISIVTNGKSVEICNGDKISLLADQYWYKIGLEEMDHPPKLEDDVKNGSIKREHDGTDEEDCKKFKEDGKNETEEIKAEVNNTESEVKQELNLDVTNDMAASGDSTRALNSELLEEPPKVEEPVPKDDLLGQPSTSGTHNNVWRQKCWYGENCYRRKVEHRLEFRHPGDADYDSDPNDTRPFCAYNTKCYRKNKMHFQQFRHTMIPRSKSRNRPKKSYAESSDYNDLRDPFSDDGSSDEFEPFDFEESDSDYSEL